MKKTSYIIIALAILPIVMVFLSPFILSLYVEKDGSRLNQMEIALSKNLLAEEMPAFNGIDINIDDLGNSDKVMAVVRKGEANRILLPDNIISFTESKVGDGCLSIKIEDHDNSYHYLEGDTLLVIETPGFDTLKLNSLTQLKIEGFDCDSAQIDFHQNVDMEDCRIKSLELINAGKLNLTNSHIGAAHVEAETYFKASTWDSSIDSMTLTTNRKHLKFTYNDANIGRLQILPKRSDVSIQLQGPITINNDSYGIND